MSRTHLSLLIALLLSVGMNIGLLLPRMQAPGSDQPRLERPRMHRVVARLIDELDLNEAQIPEFKALQRRFFEQTHRARRRVASSQAALRRELGKNPPDQDQIDSLLEELGQAHHNLERVFVDNLLATREILDLEQQRRLLRFLGRLGRNQRRPPLTLDRRSRLSGPERDPRAEP